MTRRKPVNKPRGKPFQGGKDARRNMGGNLNAAAQSYEIRFRNALASNLKPDEFALIVIEEVRRHRPGAREFYADRLMGKVMQTVGGQGGGPIQAKMIVEVIHTREPDAGSGNGGNGDKRK